MKKHSNIRVRRGIRFAAPCIERPVVSAFIVIVAGSDLLSRPSRGVMAKTIPPRPSTARKPRVPKAAASTAKIVSMTPAPLDPAMVAVRAYEIFLEHGSVHGYDLEHWLQAERELLNERLTSAA